MPMPRPNGPEFRFYDDKVEIRENGDKKTAVGYAAKYNKKSKLLYGMFEEIIRPGAFDGADMADARSYFNHNRDKILGRLKAGTLRIIVDEIGLRYEVDIPETSAGKDLIISSARGDVDQSSFAFEVEEDEWDERANPPLRTIIKYSKIKDVSPVSDPAYDDTSFGAREMDGIGLNTTTKLLEIQEKRTFAALDDARLEIELRTKM